MNVFYSVLSTIVAVLVLGLFKSDGFAIVGIIFLTSYYITLDALCNDKHEPITYKVDVEPALKKETKDKEDGQDS